MNGWNLLLLAAAVVAAPVAAYTADQLPAGSKTAAEIAALLEQQGHGPFHEISFDDGVWEVELLKQGHWVEMLVDTQSGKVLSERREELKRSAPSDAQKLSATLLGLEKAGYEQINEVSFEQSYWEIEAFRNGQKHELHVNPKSGEVLSDRIDD